MRCWNDILSAKNEPIAVQTPPPTSATAGIFDFFNVMIKLFLQGEKKRTFESEDSEV